MGTLTVILTHTLTLASDQGVCVPADWPDHRVCLGRHNVNVNIRYHNSRIYDPEEGHHERLETGHSPFGLQSRYARLPPAARPSADEWLVAFTRSFVQNPDATHATDTLMSSLRFFTAEFVAGMASLPSPEMRQPPIGGRIPRAIDAATVPIIEDVFQKLISRNAGAGAIDAFAQAVPVLVGEYSHSMR